MDEKIFILSSAGLKNLYQQQNIEGEFKFIFGNHEIKMKNVFAEFISPYVSQIHRSDITIDCISFCSQCLLDLISDEVYSLFLSLSKGEAISITKQQSTQLQLISILIKNDELFLSLSDTFDSELNNKNTTIEEQLDSFSFLQENISQLSVDKTTIFSYLNNRKSVDYIAKNFYTLSDQKIIEIPITCFYSILQNDNLTIDNEDWLLDIIELYFQNHNADQELNKTAFYEEINFNFLSSKKFKHFIHILDSENISQNLWRRIKKNFYQTVEPKKKLKKKFSESQFKRTYLKFDNDKIITKEYDNTTKHQFKGLIHYLTKKCSGNVADENVVKVTSSSVNSNLYLPKFAVDLDDQCHFFQSANMQNSWIQYDFRERRIVPSYYTIRTRHNAGKNGNHPAFWVIEGSNDNESWTTLDSRQSVTTLDDRNAVQTFRISSNSVDPDGYRFVRMRQTSHNTYGNYFLTLSALEYFGTLIKVE